MFRFTQEPSSGSYNQSLVKITSLVQLCVSVETWSELWLHIVAWCACVSFTVQRSTDDGSCMNRNMLESFHKFNWFLTI